MKLVGLALVMLSACGMAVGAIFVLRLLHATGIDGGAEWLVAFVVVVIALFCYAAVEESRL